MGYPRDQSAVPAAQSVKPMVAPARPRQRCSQPMPFDPEELSQKLAKVLADQRLHAERRRRTRAEATVAAATGSTPAISQAQDAHPTHAGLARGYLEKGSLKPGHSITRPGAEPPVVKPTSETAEPTSARLKSKASDDDRRSSQSAGKGSFRRKAADVERHHFIPQFAASQFTRTTTAENMSDSKGLVRKLSRTALRLAQGHRERHQERANVQREQMPEIAEMGNARAYGDRNHRHTIEGTLGAGRTAEMRQARGTRPVSTGDLLMAWDSEAPSPCPDDTTDIPAEQNPYEHRVDWTQSDEIQPQPKPKPSLRRADSIWALKNKLGAFTKHGRDENHSRETSPPSDVSRSPKGGFFSRFKVNH